MYSQDSGVQSATTTGPVGRPYDGGTFTLTPGPQKLTVNVAQSAQNSTTSVADGHYRAKIAQSENGPWTVAGTFAVPLNLSYGFYTATSFELTGLESETQYFVKLALDNNE